MVPTAKKQNVWGIVLHLLALVQMSILWQYVLSYANIQKIKRIKRYHIKSIGIGPLLILINIVIFDQFRNENIKKKKKLSDWNPGYTFTNILIISALCKTWNGMGWN